jgi:hypothetical protein
VTTVDISNQRRRLSEDGLSRSFLIGNGAPADAGDFRGKGHLDLNGHAKFVTTADIPEVMKSDP